jgi:hypothetical protein
MPISPGCCCCCYYNVVFGLCRWLSTFALSVRAADKSSAVAAADFLPLPPVLGKLVIWPPNDSLAAMVRFSVPDVPIVGDERVDDGGGGSGEEQANGPAAATGDDR